MLILPPGHAEQVARRSLSRREKRLVGGVLAVLAILALVLLVAIGSGGQSSGNGCIYATIPGPVGAQQVSQCGAQARDTCLTARTPGSFTPQAERVVAAECRRAGLRVGG